MAARGSEDERADRQHAYAARYLRQDTDLSALSQLLEPSSAIGTVGDQRAFSAGRARIIAYATLRNSVYIAPIAT